MNSTYSSDNRIVWVDMLKGVAILAVMIGHLMPHTYIGDFVYSFSVPLFIFVSGYLFRRYNSFKEFLTHKFKSLLIPYLMFGLPFPLVIAFYNASFTGGSYSPISVADYFLALLQELYNYVIQIRYQVIWYLAMIFLVNVVMYFILLIKHRWVQIAIILLLLTSGGLYYHFGGKPLIWNIDTVIMALPFFYVGHLLSDNGKCVSWITSMKKSRAILLFAFLLLGNIIFNLLTHYISGESLDMYFCQYGVLPFTYISAFMGIFAFMILSIILRSRFVEFFGRHSLIYFILHQGVMYFLNLVILPMLNITSLATLVGDSNYNLMDYPMMIGLAIVYLAIIVLVIWLVILTFSRTPIKKYF